MTPKQAIHNLRIYIFNEHALRPEVEFLAKEVDEHEKLKAAHNKLLEAYAKLSVQNLPELTLEDFKKIEKEEAGE